MSQKLLCVTQNPRGKQPLFRSLESHGYDVDVATDRRGALHLSEQEPYDVALLDEHVEQENGIEIFRAIDRRQKEVDGILCCQNPTVDRVHSAIAAGMDHVMAKPVDSEEVVSLIAGLASESSRRFDLRFPNAPRGFQTEDGMMKGHRQLECELCGHQTHWFHKRMQAYFCCKDCLMRFSR